MKYGYSGFLDKASPERRERYEINWSRPMIIWDADKGAINDEMCLADYLGTGRECSVTIDLMCSSLVEAIPLTLPSPLRGED
ncbi:MAG: hypothetical protein AB1797_09835 [bacterium]